MTNEEAADQVWSEIVAEYEALGVTLEDKDRATFENTLFFPARVSDLLLKQLVAELTPAVATFCRWIWVPIGAAAAYHVVRWMLA